jgi:1D-myo-inositol-tetrakisphosphate 5-kinase/inositol-polyphosphate multikinase
MSPVPLPSQVGGHSGVLATEDEAMVIKPALPLELEFYQTHILDAALEPLRPFLPRFYGSLKLEGMIDESVPDALVVKPIDGIKDAHRDEYICTTRVHHFTFFLS